MPPRKRATGPVEVASSVDKPAEKAQPPKKRSKATTKDVAAEQQKKVAEDAARPNNEPKPHRSRQDD
ncbi:hypothetical protein MMC30_001491, partial [Trapelia coarctata]|nr:hypothetical protein [Trapelia coarctata]